MKTALHQPASFDLLGGKLHVYRRENSRFFQCSTYLAGRNHRATTKHHDPERAIEAAEEWYLSLKVKHRSGELKGGKLFQDAATKFEGEYAALVAGERNPEYVKGHSLKLRVHLLPFFGEMPVAEITDQTVQDYRVHRMTSRKDAKTGQPKRPSRSTLHQEIITLRHVLKTARRLGWIKFIPDVSSPYKANGKVTHRAWFSLPEYNSLVEATRKRAEEPPKKRWKWECEQLHDFVLFMANTGLRPDEAARLEFRDVEIVKDPATKETILEIAVRGKRGTGYCKSMPMAVFPFQRLQARKRVAERKERGSWAGSTKINESQLSPPQPTDLIFPDLRHHHLNAVLDETKLKFDREGLRRSAYSLRHTYICFRLMEGADIYQIAKNCRTSVEMIEKFYAAHIKNMIDTAAVNVMKKRSKEPRPEGAAKAERPEPKREAKAKRRKTGGKYGKPAFPQ
ncbi:MAG: site-specific integrase [Rhodospirillaceae bacterium]|nr:MAG: site-specific integrase [Rhodospirillaceae bacterium]